MGFYIANLDYKFQQLHQRSGDLLAKIPTEKLYWRPRRTEGFLPVYSCGEYLVRSAAQVEQTFGGITTKLWDDPFEWTLPEHLSTKEKILEYLAEVEETRQRGFALLLSDNDLAREIPTPVKLKSLFCLLLDTYGRAENLQGRAIATFRLFSNDYVF
jgi:hypothetical protein